MSTSATDHQWATHDCHLCSSSANYNVNSNFYFWIKLYFNNSFVFSTFNFLMLKLFFLWRPLRVKQPGQKQVPLLDFTALFHTHQTTHYWHILLLYEFSTESLALCNYISLNHLLFFWNKLFAQRIMWTLFYVFQIPPVGLPYVH